MLQKQVLDGSTLELLKELMRTPCCKGFELGGGTALALRLGHRISVDLDLFTPSTFARAQLAMDLGREFELEILEQAQNTLLGRIQGVRVDLIRYSYPQLQEGDVIEGIRILSLPDIAAMKLSALANRGAKKDFYDIAKLCQACGFTTLLKWYRDKFPQTDLFPLLKSLQYFEDAELEPEPALLDCPDWQEVKRILGKAVEGA